MSTRRAFTLIEVLVVIAVLAILAALLLPVLSRAKDSGRRAACTSNLHQLFIATSLYAADHEGVYPPDSATHHWPHQLFSGYENLDVLRCPADPAASQASGPVSPDTAPRSFVMNSFADEFAASAPQPSLSGSISAGSPSTMNEYFVRLPSDTVIFGEKKSGKPAFIVDVTSSSQSPLQVVEHSRHGRGKALRTGGSNHAYADGSTRFIPYGQSLSPVNQWAVTDALRTNTAALPR